MIDQNPIKTDVRRRRRQERFGELDPKCVLCGHPELETPEMETLEEMETLTPVTPGWLKEHGIEYHHVVAAERDSEFVVPLCLNCHRKATEGLARADVAMTCEENPVKQVASMLEGLAAFFDEVVDALRRWAATLRKSLEEESSDE